MPSAPRRAHWLRARSVADRPRSHRGRRPRRHPEPPTPRRRSSCARPGSELAATVPHSRQPCFAPNSMTASFSSGRKDHESPRGRLTIAVTLSPMRCCQCAVADALWPTRCCRCALADSLSPTRCRQLAVANSLPPICCCRHATLTRCARRKRPLTNSIARIDARTSCARCPDVWRVATAADWRARPPLRTGACGRR